MGKTLFTITASLLGLASASAQDVYVYKAGVPNALCGVPMYNALSLMKTPYRLFLKTKVSPRKSTWLILIICFSITKR